MLDPTWLGTECLHGPSVVLVLHDGWYGIRFSIRLALVSKSRFAQAILHFDSQNTPRYATKIIKRRTTAVSNSIHRL